MKILKVKDLAYWILNFQLLSNKVSNFNLTLGSRPFFEMPAHYEQLETHMHIQILIDYQIW